MTKKDLDSVLAGPFWEQREELIFVRGTILSEQYAKADHFYLLQEGKANLYITVEEIGKRKLVGTCSSKNSPLGWSTINAPYRHAATAIVASPQAKLVRWKLRDLLDFLDTNPLTHLDFLQVVHEHSKKLVIHTSKFLDNTPPPRHFPIEPKQAENGEELEPSNEKALNMLRKSPFFEVFEEIELERFSKVIIHKQYQKDQLVCNQGESCNGIFLLDRGDVSIFFTSRDKSQVPIRQVTESGYLLGWLALPGEKNLLSAKVNRSSHMYVMPEEAFNTFIREDPKLAIAFYKRVLWLITVQLQTLRARLIAKKYDQEWLSIQALLQQNATRVNLTSDLLKVPYLLKSPITLNDAFSILDSISNKGDATERYLSTICLDILRETRKEQKFYDGLVKVYDTVIKQPKHVPGLEVRKESARALQNVFSEVNYEIAGWENLPHDTGHIFIYNHLKNHPYNTLPNQFQITLDSHFISSMIIFEKYGDPGTRIVRIGRSSEYGHQNYYERLSHINVYTPESELSADKAYLKEQARQEFFQKAEKELDSGRNLVISPEGTSLLTEESPGIFRPGAFKLALELKKEPLIVPIAIANFDKRMRYNTLKCIIHPPFKMSEKVANKDDKEAMREFLVNYQQEFTQKIREAVALEVDSCRAMAISA